MASTLLADNGVSSGSAGLKSSADSTGVLALQTTTSGGTVTTAVTVDNNQNVGVGVTPSTWTSSKAVEVGFAGNGIWSFAAGAFYFTSNAYYNAGWKYAAAASTASGNYQISGGAHAWSVAAAGTAGNAITFTQAMTLDVNGRLLLNTSSASSLNPSRLEISSNGLVDGDGGGNELLLKKAEFNAGSQTATMFRLQSGVSTQGQLAMGLYTNSGGVVGSFIDQVSGSGGITLRTAGTDRVTLGPTGAFFVPYIYNTTGAGSGTVVVGTDGLLFRSSSSARYKKDIVDARYGLADVLKLRAVNYVGAGSGDTDKVLGGLIAEEVDAAGLNEFVIYNEEGQPDAIHYAQMVSLAFKAIQEQQAMIQTLTERITALEGAQA